ncbi:HNH endonuclease domain-containing protein [Algoriphagus boritolerans]|uniref:HNH endonuclease domain-containing protein n=1 Tax=Algoriphagus boritolerans TaxID=308111 RepID=UPI003A0FF22D
MSKLKKIQVDHVIPFAIWKNNDLWNLLPAVPKINNNKRDKIPTPRLIESQKKIILHYWEMLDESYNTRFQSEIKISLLGNNDSKNWRHLAIDQMKESCNFFN